MGCICSIIFKKSDNKNNPYSDYLPPEYKFKEIIYKNNRHIICKYKLDNKDLTCKIFNKSSKIDSWQNEIEILKYIQNQNKNIKTAIYNGIFFGYTKIFLFYEYIPGKDLYYFIENNSNLSNQKKISILYRIIKIIYELHQINIWHLDLKPENILCVNNNPYELKLIDFDHSCIVKNETKITLQRIRGTKGYMAPEIFYNIYYDTTDVWTIGCIFYILLFREMPLPCNNYDIKKMIENPYDFKKDNWWYNFNKIPLNYRNLLNSLLNFKPLKRIKIKKLYSHEIFTTVI